MRKNYYLILTLFLYVSVSAQTVAISDDNFKLKLLDAKSTNNIAKNLNGVFFKIDANNNQEIENSEALQVSELNLSGFDITDISEIQQISDLEGIQSFTNLKKLDCSYNTLTNLNLSSLVNLTAIDCKNNFINILNVNGLIKINSIDCKSNLITSLNLTGFNNLTTLVCNENRISKLNLTGLVNLKTLDCGLNLLTTLDLREQTNLIDLWCHDNNLFSLFIKNGRDENLNDISGNPNLFYICLDDIQLTKVKTLADDLNYVKCVFSNDCNASDPIITIPDPKFKAKLLQADSSHFIAETITGIPIKIDENYDGEIQVKEALKVTNLYIDKSQIANLSGIEYFTNLAILECANNTLINLDVTQLKKLSYLNCKENLLTSLSISGLSNLNYLECQGNSLINLDLTGISNLVYLDCFANKLKSLNITNLVNLENLNCNNNKITSINLQGLTKITSLFCAENLLSGIDITGLSNLRYLEIWNNQITTIDLSNSSQLISLYAGNNPITSFDFSKVPNLQNLWCGYTLVSTVDLSNLKVLTGINVSGCPNLEFISLKNGSYEGLGFYEKQVSDLQLDGRNFSNCPKLSYICGDEAELTFMSQKISSYNYTNCVIGSYCSFTMGGNNYTIQGNVHLDSNNNGCDALDSNVSNMKFNITDGDVTEDAIANETGKYAITVKEGFYTITPIVENPAYFTISPTVAYADFTSGITSFSQDFCIAPIGSHNDLKVTLMALDPARTGQDVKYKIIYNNKGTTTQSGTINLVFNDAVSNLITATPTVTSHTTNNLSWSFSNLAPLETKEISFVLNLPAVNNGDLLNYTATITSSAQDELPKDNTFAFNQKVTLSNSKNDKTCLEGEDVGTQLIGDYVHYLIRFENTGTNVAKNIVVKDIIDLSKFDISTLVPIKASHNFVTRISDGNKVEFIFENVNLPFNDATNDGYIAFKIKTLPQLTTGNSFENEANIYFDYNAPIVTNKATSTFKTLGTTDFEFADYFSVYPNPATDILNLATKNSVEIESIAVYNILGQLVIAIPNAKKVSNIDVSKLITGNYFLKINTDRGTSNIKFIKK